MRWLVALLLLTGVAFAQSQQPSPTIRNEQQSQTEPQQTKQPGSPDQRGTEALPLAVKIIPSTKSEADTAKEEAERREKSGLNRKLVEFNGKLADYTLILAIVAVLQFIVLAVQAVFLGATVRIARTSLRDIERAWLVTGPSEVIEILPGNRTRIYIGVSNSGRTKGICNEIGLICFQNEPTALAPDYAGAKIIAPATSIGPQPEFLPTRWFADHGTTNPFYFAGYMRYLDIFGKTHHTRFCSHIIPLTGQAEGGKGPPAWNEDD